MANVGLTPTLRALGNYSLLIMELIVDWKEETCIKINSEALQLNVNFRKRQTLKLLSNSNSIVFVLVIDCMTDDWIIGWSNKSAPRALFIGY